VTVTPAPEAPTRRQALAALPGWLRSLATMVALSAAAALVLGVIYPVARGSAGTLHAGVVVEGLVQGSIYALTAAALILIYRISRIINFAQVAIGSAAGYFLTQMAVGYELSTLAMIPIALATGALAGVLAELAMRRFAWSPRLYVTVATITLAPAATLVMGRIVSSLNPLPTSSVAAARIEHLRVPVPFPEWSFRIDPFPFGFAEVFVVAATILAMVGLTLILKATRVGRAVRATADNPEAAALIGINTRLLSTMVWGLAALLSGLASVGSLLVNGIDLVGNNGGTATLLPALAACMAAGFESIPLAVFLSLWLYVLQQGTAWVFPTATFVEPVLLVIAVFALLLRRRTLQRRQKTEAGLSQAIRSLRPPPRALRGLPVVQRMRATVFLVVGAIVIAYPFVVSRAQTHAAGIVLIYAMVAISLLIITGWVGQINLGQFAVVAIGAIISGGLVAHLGLSFWIALPVAMVACGLLTVLLGLAAMRIQGLWLAPLTLVLAAAVPVIFFVEPWFGWLVPQSSVDRPGLPFVSLDNETTLYFVLVAAAVGVASAAIRFRHSRLGRSVIALRDNEAAALASGIDALSSRVVALAFAGVIAGLAGGLYEVFQQGVYAQSYGADASLSIFIMLVLGGLGGVSGAVLGAVFGGTMLYITPDFAPLITGAGALLMLLVLPGGLSQGVLSVRDGVLRLIAVRRGIDVPSLLGTSDAAAERRWRLATRAGTEEPAEAAARRYSRPSFLWGRTK
jgi:branched-chain amino acid transport system permease protein